MAEIFGTESQIAGARYRETSVPDPGSPTARVDGVLPDVVVLSMTFSGNERFAVPDESETVGGSDSLELCNAFVAALPIADASVAVLAGFGARLSLYSTDAIAARVDELQFELGEGPQLSVSRFGNSMGIPDVAQHLHHEWPVFGAALHELWHASGCR